MDNGHDAAAQQPGTPRGGICIWRIIQSHSYNGILGLLVVAISGVGCAFMIFAAAASFRSFARYRTQHDDDPGGQLR